MEEREKNHYIKFVCTKCIAGDAHRRKSHDRKFGRNKYAYVCDKCGHTQFYDTDGLIVIKPIRQMTETAKTEKKTIKNRIDEARKKVVMFKKRGTKNVINKESDSRDAKK